ncbi:MAG TPA: TonB-dependent receptor, partial [Planctomycetaceae bacterium]|nr:TonB-dependent receptor [Planctomycetaceae bacterium]
DTVLSATSAPTRAEQVGSSVTVISGESIRRAGFQNAAEALRTIPGVNVVRQGNVGGLTSVFLRGANSQHTKVLLDGIPLNDPSGATRAFDFSLLTVDEIERIEILRGPQSVLYGSDAIGGVVNIITKRGEGPVQVRATGEGGSYGTGRGTFHMSGGGSRAYFSIGGSYWDTDGFSSAARRLGNLEADGYKNGTIGGRFGWTPSDALSVDYVVRYVDADVEIDDFDFGTGLPTDNLIRRNLTKTLWQRIQLQSVLWDGMFEQRVGLSLADYDRFDTDPGLFVPPAFQGLSQTVDYQGSLQVTPHNVLSAGVVFYRETASSSFQSKVGQEQLSAYVEDQFQLADYWYGTIGVRWDDHSKAGTAQTYRFTNRIPLESLRAAIHGSIGTGFRAPALAENLFQYGNPNLRPEFSKGWDIGWQQRLWGDAFIVDATYFRNDFTNLIVFDFNTFSLENVGKARSHGVEVTAVWQPVESWRFTAAYTYDDTVDLDNNRQLYRRPRNYTSLVAERFYSR